MTDIRGALRVADVATVPELAREVNIVLGKLLGQDRRRWNLEPARRPVTTVTAAYSATEGDWLIRVDTSGGGVTVTLPTAAAMKGLLLTVKKSDGGANTLTVDANGSETIDGATTATTTAAYGVLRLISNGSSWDLL